MPQVRIWWRSAELHVSPARCAPPFFRCRSKYHHTFKLQTLARRWACPLFSLEAPSKSPRGNVPGSEPCASVDSGCIGVAAGPGEGRATGVAVSGSREGGSGGDGAGKRGRKRGVLNLSTNARGETCAIHSRLEPRATPQTDQDLSATEAYQKDLAILEPTD